MTDDSNVIQLSAHSKAAPQAELVQIHPEFRPLPPEHDETALVDLYDSLDPGPYGVRVQANFVQTVDGAVVGGDGRSGSISSPADKRVFSVLRSLADAVVVGAGTARAEGYTRLSPKPRHLAQRRLRQQDDVPALVLVTRSGRIDIERLEVAGNSPVIVHTTTRAEAELTRLRSFCGTENVVVHEDHEEHDGVPPLAVLEDLAGRGFVRILTEGGPALMHAWVCAGAVDELCLTVSPLLVGMPRAAEEDIDGSGPAPSRLLGDLPLPEVVRVRLMSSLTDGATIIQRYSLR